MLKQHPRAFDLTFLGPTTGASRHQGGTTFLSVSKKNRIAIPSEVHEAVGAKEGRRAHLVENWRWFNKLETQLIGRKHRKCSV